MTGAWVGDLVVGIAVDRVGADPGRELPIRLLPLPTTGPGTAEPDEVIA